MEREGHEGGWRLVTELRKEKEDAAGLRQEKEKTDEAREVVTAQESIEPSKRRRLVY